MKIKRNSDPAIKKVVFGKHEMHITLNNTKVIDVPYNYTDRLKKADISIIKNNYRLIAGGRGIHFDEIDEDISLKGILEKFDVKPERKPVSRGRAKIVKVKAKKRNPLPRAV